MEIIDYIEDEIVLVAAPSHPIAQLSSLTAQQVVREGLIVREVGSATRQTAERHLESLGVSPEIALELGSNEAVKQAAAAGGGIGVVSRLGVTAEGQGWHADCPRGEGMGLPASAYAGIP